MGYLYNTDIIQQIAWVGYRNFKPFGIFREFFLNFNQWYGTTFGWEKLYFGFNGEAIGNFKNYWNANAGFSFDAESMSPSELRGGPSLLYSPTVNFYYQVSTDSRKKLIFSLGGNHNIGTSGQFNYMNFFSGITWRVNQALRIDLRPNVVLNNNNLAYVNNVEDSLSVYHYIRGTLNQVETSITIRLTYNITPDFTIQYYGMPFVSAGDYSKYKYILNPVSHRYYERYGEFTNQEIATVYNGDDIVYSVNTNADGREDYTFDNPDFNNFEYRSNLIARWEYLPGSTVYLVWSFTQNRYENQGRYSFADDMGEIFKVHPHNVFLIKISHRFGL